MPDQVQIPTLRTERLLLRPFVDGDADRLVRLLEPPEIARWTAAIPHPYTGDDAERYIGQRRRADQEGVNFGWAIAIPADDLLIGAIGLKDLNWQLGHAEIGYWLGMDYWNYGFATEAARRVVNWAFEETTLFRIQATHLPGNEGSARIMRKIGMHPEGVLRGYSYKGGERSDLHLCSVLRTDEGWRGE